MAKTTGYFIHEWFWDIELVKNISERENITISIHPTHSTISHINSEGETWVNMTIRNDPEFYKPTTEKIFLSALKEALSPINKYISETIIEQPEYGSHEINDAKNA